MRRTTIPNRYRGSTLGRAVAADKNGDNFWHCKAFRTLGWLRSKKWLPPVEMVVVILYPLYVYIISQNDRTQRSFKEHDASWCSKLCTSSVREQIWQLEYYPRYGGRGSMRQYPDIDGHLESLWEGIWSFCPQKLRFYPQKLQHSYGKWLTENNHLPNKHGDLPSDTISSSPIDDLHGHPNANWRAADPLRYPLRDAGRCATRSGRRSRRPFPVPSTKASQGYMDEM